MKAIKWTMIISALMLTALACNDRNKETESTKTNVSDTRRNNTDTSNYISDSAGKKMQ
jgi:hypothetical protein